MVGNIMNNTTYRPVVKTARPMRAQPFSRSPVDIIIPFHGQYEKVTRLIESILYVTKSNPYQIVLVDDCSPNTSYISNLKDTPQIVTFRTPKQMGFGGALQYAFNQTQQPWVVFMHSDCVVEDQGWLIELGKSLLRWRDSGVPVKMVSARTNNPGEQYDAGLKAAQRSKNDDMILQEGCLPLYCAMCHRSLFKYIKGFIKPYFPCFYEDEELAYRMKKYGFKQGVCGRSWIRHHSGATVDALCTSNHKMKNLMEENRVRCLQDMKSLA
jgi:GT2 family glycosyltransferase